MDIPSSIAIMESGLNCCLTILVSHLDPDVSEYALDNIIPYDCSYGRTCVSNTDEYAITLYCKVRGVHNGELVLQGTLNRFKNSPRRQSIFIQYDGHPETLGYDFTSIGDAIAVLRLLAAGKIKGAHGRLRKTREE